MPGNAVTVAANPGIDTRMGRARNQGSSTRSKRLRKIGARLKRLRKLKSGGARGVERIFNAGVKPQAFYGAEVAGVSDRELL